MQVVPVTSSLEEAAPQSAPYIQEEAEAPAPTPEPAAAPGEQPIFEAVLTWQESEQPLGLKADFADGKVIHVCRVTGDAGTVIAKYNASVGDEKKIKVGDYLMAINGVSHSTVPASAKVADALLEQLTTSKSATVKVSRPNLFTCKVEKNGQPMGLELAYSNNGTSLIVAQVAANGAVQISAPEVKEGDRIVGVGDVEGNPAELLRAIRDAGETMMLKMSRPHEG